VLAVINEGGYRSTWSISFSECDSSFPCTGRWCNPFSLAWKYPVALLLIERMLIGAQQLQKMFVAKKAMR
jgi:hypothetical protein